MCMCAVVVVCLWCANCFLCLCATLGIEIIIEICKLKMKQGVDQLTIVIRSFSLDWRAMSPSVSNVMGSLSNVDNDSE